MLFYKLSFELIGEPPQLVQIYIEPQHKLICNAQSVWSVEGQIVWETKDDDGISEIKPKNNPENKLMSDSQADKIWEISEKNTKNRTKQNQREQTENNLFEDFSTENTTKKTTKNRRNKPQIEEIEKGFLEKLWGATKKSLQNFFPTPIPKNQKTSHLTPKGRTNVEEKNHSSEEKHEEINAKENLENEHTEISPKEENHLENLDKKEEINVEEKKNEGLKWVFSSQLTHFYNPDQYIRTIVCGGDETNGQVLCIDLAEMPNYKILCKQNAFVIARFGTKISCFWKNEIQKTAFLEIQGDDYIFLKSNHFLKEYYLEDDTIIVPLHKLLAFQNILHFSEINNKTLLDAHTQSEIMLVQLTGRGKYWIG